MHFELSEFELSSFYRITWGYVSGADFLSFNLSMVSLSSRRSSFVPTSITGVSGQWWLTSGYHWNSDDSDSNNTKTSSIRGHSWSASETPFKWRFAGGPIMGPILCCLCNKQKCLVVDKIMLVSYVVNMHTRYFSTDIVIYEYLKIIFSETWGMHVPLEYQEVCYPLDQVYEQKCLNKMSAVDIMMRIAYARAVPASFYYFIRRSIIISLLTQRSWLDLYMEENTWPKMVIGLLMRL